jgi:beta-lactamase regulating signal transducer with metallopeptidase domain
MLEIVLLLFLSIIFTFTSYIISKILIKKLKINHPQNRAGIFFSVILTTLLILTILGGTLLGTTKNTYTINNQIENEEQITLLKYPEPLCAKTTLLGDNSGLKQLPFESIEQIKIPRFYNVFLSSNQLEMYFYETSFILKQSVSMPKMKYTNDNNPVTITNNSHKSQDMSLFALFWNFNIILILAGIIYLLLSLTIVKTYILRILKVERCYDHNILNLIEDIVKDFDISMPTVYTYKGSANAFVFGYRPVLIFSNQLPKILTSEELKQTFRHELTHIKNKDNILKPFLQSLRILFFYNPFVHLAYYNIIKNRELLADNYRIWSKSQRINYMEAIIKIQEHAQISKTSSVLTALCTSFTIPLISLNPKKLSINDRFDSLFNNMIKKSTFTFLIGIILIIINLSFFSITQNIVLSADEIKTNGIDSDIYYVSEGYPVKNYGLSCGCFDKHNIIYYKNNIYQNAIIYTINNQRLHVVYQKSLVNFNIEYYNNAYCCKLMGPFEIDAFAF